MSNSFKLSQDKIERIKNSIYGTLDYKLGFIIEVLFGSLLIWNSLSLLNLLLCSHLFFLSSPLCPTPPPHKKAACPRSADAPLLLLSVGPLKYSCWHTYTTLRKLTQAQTLPEPFVFFSLSVRRYQMKIRKYNLAHSTSGGGRGLLRSHAQRSEWTHLYHSASQ